MSYFRFQISNFRLLNAKRQARLSAICSLSPIPHPLLPAAQRRRGISLLEVLISMFVMLVGLLGVASLIPVGRSEVQKGAKIDRAAVQGRSAFREAKIRGMLNPATWATIGAGPAFNGAPVCNLSATPPVFSYDAGATTSSLLPVVIDPLGVGDGDTSSRSFGRSFPYDATNPPAATFPRIPRITLGPTMTQTARVAVVDSVFRGSDDLVFDATAGGDKLPFQKFFTDTSNTGVKRLSEGDYSWLATIVPDPNLTNIFDPLSTSCRVSVVVFYKRDLSAAGASERMCQLVNVTGNGETQLQVDAATAAAAPYNGDGVKFLDVKPGQWLMIATTANASVGPWLYSWQRIVSADSVQGPIAGAWTRYVTLQGQDQQGYVAPGQNVAFLFDGVIAVYDKTMKFELDSLYQ